MPEKATIKYLNQREILGKKLALTFNGGKWPEHYNEEQRKFWYNHADELLAFMKDQGWLVNIYPSKQLLSVKSKET